MVTNKAPHGASFIAIAAFAVFCASSSANAASFSISQESPPNNTSHTLTSGFNPAGWSNPDGVGVGTTITTFTSANDGCTPSCGNPATGLFVTPGNISLTFTFMGKEASDLDLALLFNGTQIFSNQSSAVGSSSTINFTLGAGTSLVPLKFTDTTGTDKTAPNGGPIDDPLSLGFYLVNSTTAYAFFDDKNGGTPDHDFDDMVVKITIAQTPLPAALPLFAGGLGVMGGVLGWRKKRKAAVAA